MGPEFCTFILFKSSLFHKNIYAMICIHSVSHVATACDTLYKK